MGVLEQLTEREWLMAEARDPFRTPDRGPRGLEYNWAWQRKTAIEVPRYCCESGDLLAAVGSVEAGAGCAAINGAGSEFLAPVHLAPVRPISRSR